MIWRRLVAHSHSLPEVTRVRLAGQISRRLSRVGAAVLKASGTLELGESFDVWFLGQSAITNSSARLATVARRTGYWHHQIRHNGKGTEYARSEVHGPGAEDWKIHAIYSSDLAGKIDETIGWIDLNYKDNDDPLAHILIIPAYFVTAFWLEGTERDEIVMIEGPVSLKILKTEHLYSSQDFLALLTQERRVQGVPRNPPARRNPSSD